MPGSAERAFVVVSGGLEAVPGIERVQALGLRVAVTDQSLTAPGMRVANDRLVVSTYDVEATVAQVLEYHTRYDVCGVMSIASDVPRTVAACTDALGLPGPSMETAELASDKLAMKRRFAADGVPIPWFAAVDSAAQLADALASRNEPLVIKPVDSRGARGVRLLQPGLSMDELETHLAHALEHSPTGRTLVEEFVPGPQLSTESVVLDGRVTTLGCSDRNYERLDQFAPSIIEDGGVQPTGLLEAMLDPVDAVIGVAARSIGLTTGTIKGDLVVHPQRGPVVIEVAPRLSGGWFCTDQIPYSTGVDLVQVAARLAMGEEVTPEEIEPKGFAPIAVRYFFPPPGLLRSVEGIEELEADPDVHRVVLFAQPGELLEPVSDHTRRAGLVLTTGATREAAVAKAEDAVASIRFHVD